MMTIIINVPFASQVVCVCVSMTDVMLTRDWDPASKVGGDLGIKNGRK